MIADVADPKSGKSLHEEIPIEKKPETASAKSAGLIIDLDHPKEPDPVPKPPETPERGTNDYWEEVE